MMLLMQAEWKRFLRNRVNLFILLAVALLSAGSAIWSGLAAAEYRQRALLAQQQWQEKASAVRSALATSQRPNESTDAARDTFNFARNEAPVLNRPAFGGLALSVRQFVFLPSVIKISIEGRHLDGRRSEPIENPLLESHGLADFAVIAALLLPLAIIGLSYGLVQEARQAGIWRLVCTQCAAPWRVLFCGLLVRYLSTMVLFAGASLLAFGLDPGSSSSALVHWLGALTAFGLIWIAIAGLLNIFVSSASASALAMLGIWIFTTYAIPSLLWWQADRQVVAPQRLATIIQIRTIQHETESRSRLLLWQWYGNNPQHRPETIERHAWPVSFMPRYMEQDARIAPLMNRFDAARVEKMEKIGTLGWLSPGLTLVLAADRLAGADAAHHDRFMKEVDRFEDAWRDRLVPGIMSYRGMQPEDIDALASTSLQNLQRNSGVAGPISHLTMLALALLVGLILSRQGLRKP